METEKLSSGTCGTCTWQYKQLDDGKYMLEIAPIDPKRGGVLDSWDDAPPWWGPPWQSFELRANTVEIKIHPGVKATTCEGMFGNFPHAKKIDLSGLDVSDVTDMSGMFYSCESLESINLSALDVSKVTNMEQMFSDCASLTSLDVSAWDTSNVTNMRGMFEYCSALTSLNVDMWDVSKVEDMRNMFWNCRALATLNVNAWNVSSKAMTGSMFSGCSFLASLDVYEWGDPKIKEGKIQTKTKEEYAPPSLRKEGEKCRTVSEAHAGDRSYKQSHTHDAI